MPEEVPIRWNRPIFVASMGRSGSTLLQRVLNLHPDVTIWGEHGGFLSGLLESYEAASRPVTAKNLAVGYESRHEIIGELQDKDSFKPWVSPFTTEDIERSFTDHVRGLFTSELAPTTRWGFKEIRYSQNEVATLMTMFPEAQLVILARDFPGFAQSRFFAFGNTDFDFDTEEGRAAAQLRLSKMADGWIRRYQGLLAARDQFVERTSVVAYHELTEGPSRAVELFAELGETAPTTGAIESVLGSIVGSTFRHNKAAIRNRDRLIELLDGAPIDWPEYELLAKELRCNG